MMESAENMCVDLEEWQSLQDPKSRRRIQNRIAQRVYRRKRKAQRDALKRDSTPASPPKRRDSRHTSISERSVPSLSHSLSSSPYSSLSPDFCAPHPPPQSAYLESPWTQNMMLPVTPPLTADFCMDPMSLYPDPSTPYMSPKPLALDQGLTLHSFEDLCDASRPRADSYFSSGSDTVSNAPSCSDSYLQGVKGLTALQTAAVAGHELIVNLLLDEGANVEDLTATGATALHLAANAGFSSMVSLLVSRGANVNAQDFDNRTPLHMAAQQDHSSAVITLLQSGAYLDTADSFGSTPLHLAADQASQAMIQLLLDNGADVGARDAAGRNALHRAADKGHALTVKLLLDQGIDIHAKADSP